MFIYKCGLIRSTRYRAGVGINSGDSYYINHPLSNTDGVTDIDCYDEISRWSAVVYRLDQGIIITTIKITDLNLTLLLFLGV